MNLNKSTYLWIIPTIFAILTLDFVSQYTVNIPYLDHWAFISVNTGESPFNFDYLWSQHNEHRIVWQKIYDYYWAQATGWNISLQTYIVPIITIFTNFILLNHINKRIKDISFFQRILLTSIFSLLIFTFGSVHHLIAPFQFAWALLYFLFVLFSIYWRDFFLHNKNLIILTIVLFFATFSSAHGLVLNVFIILSSGYLLLTKRSLNLKKIFLALFSLALIIIYLNGLQFGVTGNSPVSILKQPINFAIYSAVYIGNGFMDLIGPAYELNEKSGMRMANASIIKIFLESSYNFYINLLGIAVFFCLAFVFLLKELKKQKLKLVYDILVNYPLLILGIGVLMLIAIGRLDSGFVQAISSRYIPFSLLISLSLILFYFEKLSKKQGLYFNTLLFIFFTLSTISWGSSYFSGHKLAELRVTPLRNFVDCVLKNKNDYSHCSTKFGPSFKEHDIEIIKATGKLQEANLAFFKYGVRKEFD